MTNEHPRNTQRIMSQIQLEFWSIVRGFEESVIPIETPIDEQSDSFKKYEAAWQRYCVHFNPTGWVRPNPNAFRSYVFDYALSPVLIG